MPHYSIIIEGELRIVTAWNLIVEGFPKECKEKMMNLFKTGEERTPLTLEVTEQGDEAVLENSVIWLSFKVYFP
ncbi:hypothetical protein RSAG8_13537, partial [Rhizoctonia solani AG-8 WAC10335]